MNTALAALSLAYANLYAQNELFITAEQVYSLSCGSENSYTSLMVVHGMIKRAALLGKTAEQKLTSKPSGKDATTLHLRSRVAEELKGAVTSHAKLKAAAERCKAYAVKRSNETAHPEDGDSPWDTTRSHAGINLLVIDDIHPEQALKLVESEPAKPVSGKNP